MFKMSYFYSPLASDFIQCVNRTQGALDVVSPDFFRISNNGLLLIDSNLTPLIDWLHRKRLKVVPFLSNHWNRDLGRLVPRNRDMESWTRRSFSLEQCIQG
jgi:spore germination protein YaaH